MTELDAILEDIRTNPADDLPRLALADWLMERDDAASRSRGEFIHARCRAASLPPRDPERASLQQRAEALRDEHEVAWLGGLAEHLDSWDFERGMIVAGLTARSFRRGAFARMAECDGWKWVLGLRGSALSDSDLKKLLGRQQLDNVTALDFRDCTIATLDARLLARSGHLIRLVYLDLGYNRLGAQGLRELVHSHVPALRTLFLDNNGISADDVLALAEVHRLLSLERLDLSRNPIGDAGATALAKCRRVGLRELRLASCGIGNRGAIALVTSVTLANLTLLDLSDNPLDEVTRSELRERFGDRVVLD